MNPPKQNTCERRPVRTTGRVSWPLSMFGAVSVERILQSLTHYFCDTLENLTWGCKGKVVLQKVHAIRFHVNHGGKGRTRVPFLLQPALKVPSGRHGRSVPLPVRPNGGRGGPFEPPVFRLDQSGKGRHQRPTLPKHTIRFL